MAQGLKSLHRHACVGIYIKVLLSSLYDEEEISQLKNSIVYERAIIILMGLTVPRRKDILSKVPSNYKLSKVIVKQVSFKNNCLDSKYLMLLGNNKILELLKTKKRLLSTISK